ncbi:hypothetical protein TRVL_02046 [Trypanosoma vivax]|uniref:Uncharacterized protein n=1 Tax=Trypanosoma vivax (strain Y486) TaxID=1055687 RepID=G0U2R8_TRYVY|nr:hypothetical protein TRVL_02046 [Trypanosoma vivax]CCC50572.1 hypothetical protein TVY486_0903930 [Trypanosoma vivax Y486]
MLLKRNATSTVRLGSASCQQVKQSHCVCECFVVGWAGFNIRVERSNEWHSWCLGSASDDGGIGEPENGAWRQKEKPGGRAVDDRIVSAERFHLPPMFTIDKCAAVLVVPGFRVT